MKILTVATALFLTVASVYGQTPKPQPRPTVRETLGWIQASLNNHGDVEEETAERTEIHAVRLADFSGCRVHFVLTESYAGKEMVHLDYYFNMGEIDPISSGFHHFDTSGPGEFIAVTQGYLEKISIPNGIIREGSGFTAEFYSPYGDDFAKAFIHAVKMCGDDPEEPIDLSDGMEPKEIAEPAVRSAPARKDIPAIAKAANGAIVSIVMSDKEGRTIAKGTGFLVSKDGRIVTNYHVIAEGGSAKVKLPDGSLFAVDGVLAFDKVRDVALIKAHGENFRTLTLGNSDKLQVGEDVVAIGNPLSLESTVSNGIVSGIRTDEKRGGKFLQVTTPISPGSSGGPLFNMMGEVVGITTMYLEGGENLNFAIPINDAKHLVLAKSSTLRALPNEPEPVKVQRHDGDAPSDRDYYQQLYDAGGFSQEAISTAPDGSKTSHGRVQVEDYACFSDNAFSGTFFTFTADAYDENYSKAWDIMAKNPSSDELSKQYSLQQAIQQEAPYVHFFRSLDWISPKVQEFFRRGGRHLEQAVYEKGVKVNTLNYEWDGNLWFVPISPTDPNAYGRKSEVIHLSIEPNTLRYSASTTVTITVGRGDTAATDRNRQGPWTGVCEKIPNPK